MQTVWHLISCLKFDWIHLGFITKGYLFYSCLNYVAFINADGNLVSILWTCVLIWYVTECYLIHPQVYTLPRPWSWLDCHVSWQSLFWTSISRVPRVGQFQWSAKLSSSGDWAGYCVWDQTIKGGRSVPLMTWVQTSVLFHENFNFQYWFVCKIIIYLY